MERARKEQGRVGAGRQREEEEREGKKGVQEDHIEELVLLSVEGDNQLILKDT